MVEKVFLYIGFILIAVFGTCVKWLNTVKTTPSTWTVLCIDIFTAAFIGCVVGSIYQWIQCSEGMAFAAAGIAGYCGTKSIDLIQHYIVKKVGIDTKNQKENEHENNS